MLLTLLLFILGLIILIKGADLLVSGASSISLKLKISPIVIGLTVVAFGTSSPELLVSTTSALQGNTDIALGNVVGSNIANILVILGLSAIIYPLKVKRNTVWKEIPMSFLGAIIMVILGIQTIIDGRVFSQINIMGTSPIGSLTLSNGLILLSFFIIFLYYTFGIAKVESEDISDVKEISTAKSILFIVGGLLSLGLGSNLLVNNATTLARLAGLSDAFIGLTLVALGTSLPELATSVSAAIKKQSDIAIGNVVGSNIFNIFLILGATAIIRPIPITGQALIDIAMLFIATIIMFISLFIGRKNSIGRAEGVFMILLYLVYIGYLIYRG